MRRSDRDAARDLPLLVGQAGKAPVQCHHVHARALLVRAATREADVRLRDVLRPCQGHRDAGVYASQAQLARSPHTSRLLAEQGRKKTIKQSNTIRRPDHDSSELSIEISDSEESSEASMKSEFADSCEHEGGSSESELKSCSES